MTTISQKDKYVIDKEELKEELTQFIDKERFEDNQYINRINNRLEEILMDNLDKSENLIEVLHEVQGLIGFIPKYVQKEVAKALNLAPGEVTSVISFYAQKVSTKLRFVKVQLVM